MPKRAAEQILAVSAIMLASGCFGGPSAGFDPERTSVTGPAAQCHRLPDPKAIQDEQRFRGAREVVAFAVMGRGLFQSRSVDGQGSFPVDCRTTNVVVTLTWTDPGVPREWRLVLRGCALDPDGGPAGASPLVWELGPDELVGHPADCDPQADLVDRTAGANANQRIEYEAVVTRWAEPSAEDRATALWLTDRK